MVQDLITDVKMSKRENPTKIIVVEIVSRVPYIFRRNCLILKILTGPL